MKKLSIVLVVAFFMVGCKSYYLMENLPNVKVPTKLPVLDVVLDEQSFATVTGYSTTATSTSTTGNTSPSFVGFGSNIRTTAQSTGTSITYASKSLHNALLMYQTNMYGIINKIGEKKGKVVCRLLMADEKLGLGWTVLSGITCCALNLFGLPLWSATVSISVEIDFFDKDDNLVATYQSKGHKVKKYCAMYWGYKDAWSVAFYECFKQCLGDINAEIKSDYNNLKSIYLK